MLTENLLCGIAGAQYVYGWNWWEGKEIIFFENDFIKEYVHKEKIIILKIELNSIPDNTYVKPVLLDIVYYCRAVETRFPIFVREDVRKK